MIRFGEGEKASCKVIKIHDSYLKADHLWRCKLYLIFRFHICLVDCWSAVHMKVPAWFWKNCKSSHITENILFWWTGGQCHRHELLWSWVFLVTISWSCSERKAWIGQAWWQQVISTYIHCFTNLQKLYDTVHVSQTRKKLPDVSWFRMDIWWTCVSLNHIHTVVGKPTAHTSSKSHTSKDVPKSVMVCLAAPLLAPEKSASPVILPRPTKEVVELQPEKHAIQEEQGTLHEYASWQRN